MGARVALALCAAKRVTPSGLLFLGFPLHKPGKREEPRLAGLAEVRRPMLFVQGTRDPFCDLDVLKRVRKERGVAGSLHVIEGGDHSYQLPAAMRERRETERERACDVIVRFVRRVLERK